MSIQVTFETIGAGTCAWCRKQKDTVYTVKFSDASFVGALCKSDLLRAVELKCPPKPMPIAEPAKPTGNVIAAK